jgi:hypothetical protein
MALPRNLPWPQADPKWAAQLDPLLANPLVNGRQIDDITLVANTPQIVYHSLGQLPQGWVVVDTNANAYIRRTQPFNTKTITLEASADAVISIWIY